MHIQISEQINTSEENCSCMYAGMAAKKVKKICLNIDQCISDNPTLMDDVILPWKTKICEDQKYHQVIF